MAPILLSDAPAPESHVATIPVAGKCVVAVELEVAVCDCCGLQEECTPEYVEMVRERFHGKWICGLCAEAVKDEVYRSNRLIGTEEALNLHMNFCKNFRSSDPATHLISAVRQLLRRSLEGPRTLGSAPSSPVAKGGVRASALSRSGSCVPTFAR
ncbi:uncharacterized protein LOC116259685 [Nymphaea colorata]|uniref:DUF1677 domain-containing protein n=1 Tax=Nymphaea colorata TaxID=210225 RepID=A0A5K1G298_9MAGN|nr:uncharacterized protein LOC116259685 [Nymphaea colorata]